VSGLLQAFLHLPLLPRQAEASTNAIMTRLSYVPSLK